MSDPKNGGVCVLGMARSGTSAVAGILGLLGVDLGDPRRLVAANEQNASGYWEQRSILELNDAILRTVGGSWDSPAWPKAGWERSPRLDFLRLRGSSLLDELFDDAPLWGFKDPRTSLTLPYWRQIAPELRYAICVRNPADVVRSYEAFAAATHRDGQRPLELWVRTTAHSIVDTEDSPRAVIRYEDLLDDVDAQLRVLSELLEQRPSADAQEAVRTFVRRDLAHHSQRRFESDGTSLGDATQLLYEALDSESPADRAREALGLVARAETDVAGDSPECWEIAQFPEDLGAIDRFGIYEDGWLEPAADVVLPPGPEAVLVLRCAVLPVEGQQLEVVVDGAPSAIVHPTQGLLPIRVPLRGSQRPRHLQLQWSRFIVLDQPDGRAVAARLRSLRVLPASNASVPRERSPAL